MEYTFLVDANLPKKFRYFNHPNFTFVCDIDLTMSDTDIWNLALNQNLVILTKDADFFHKALLSKIMPKIVYLQLGNQTIAELHYFFSKHWNKIIELLPSGNLLIVYPNEVIVIQ